MTPEIVVYTVLTYATFEVVHRQCPIRPVISRNIMGKERLYLSRMRECSMHMKSIIVSLDLCSSTACAAGIIMLVFVPV